MLPALKNSGVLDDKKVAARMKLMGAEEKKRTGVAPSDEALRERAEAGLISDDLYKSGFRGTVVDQIAHAIVNSPLINRDTAAMGKLPGAEISADIGKNPVAAFSELTSAISNFGTVLTNPAVAAAGPVLDSLARGIAMASDSLTKWEQAHPKQAVVASSGALAAAGAGLGWLGLKAYGMVAGLFGGGAGGAAASGGATAGGAGLGILGRMLPVAMSLPAAAVGAGGAFRWGVGPYGPLKDNWRMPTSSDFPTDDMFEKSRRSRMVYHPGG